MAQINENLLSVERLKFLFNYDPVKGIFIRRKSVSKTKEGDIAGHDDGKGYVQFMIDKKKYRAHRLAWLYMTGDHPKGEIDHINGIHNDNRFENLRDVIPSVNMQNQRNPRVTNKLGIQGVIRCGKKYLASISINGKTKRLGMFSTTHKAHEVYVQAKRQFHLGSTL